MICLEGSRSIDFTSNTDRMKLKYTTQDLHISNMIAA
jgi:hypothetical protein